MLEIFSSGGFRRRVCAGAVLLGVVFLLKAIPARGDVLPEGWAFRRPLIFKQMVSDAPGSNAALAEFYANGAQKPDGSDFRVTTAERVMVPFRILQSSTKDDFVRVAFETHADGPYYVWWGNPKADAIPAGKEMEMKRGIFTEIFKTPPGARAKDAVALDKFFERATPIGETFVPDIFLAYNPLGPEWDVMFRYTGHFKIDKAITAEFAFSAMDSGSLTIDSKLVAYCFRDKLRGRVHDPKAVDLPVGWHTIEVTQASIDGGDTGVVVAWKKPGDKNYNPMPASLFASIASVTAGPLEKIGTPYCADFSVSADAESFAPPDAYLQRYGFEAEYPATFTPTLTWDFGDGQTMTGAAAKIVSHIYLLPGEYTVTLKVDQNPKGAAGAAPPITFTTTRRITIKDRMYSHFPRPPEDRVKMAESILDGYDLRKVSTDQAFRGYAFLKDKGDVRADIAWGKAWVAAKEAPAENEKAFFEDVFDFSRFLEAQGDFAGAADAFRRAADKPMGLSARLNLMRYGVMASCNYTDDAAAGGGTGAALKEAQAWQKKINETDQQQMRIVDAAILYAAVAAAGNGDAANAKTAQIVLARLKTEKPANGAGYNDREIRQGVLARNIENYIRTREFDTALKLIDEWELEFPEAIWDGFTRTLRVKLAAAESRPALAARLALQLAKANPGGVYADELLYRASENFKAAKETTQAQAAMDLLKAKYPESPYSRGENKEK